MSKEIKEYLNSINEVSQITFNPNGPGSVRVHLIPPKKIKLGVAWVVIINGQDVLPLTTGWAILLREFINVATQYDGKELDDAEIKKLLNLTVTNVKKIFKKTPEATLLSDLRDIIDTLTDIAKGETPSIKIGYLTLQKYAKYMNAPHRMDLMISSMHHNGFWNCNQKCLHCYASEQKYAITKELTTEQWKQTIDKLKDAGISQLTFTGGEPTLREDLVELVNYAAWFVTRLNTNGVLLSKSLVNELKEASLDSVQVTLYSHDKNIHNILVGSPNFDKTVEGIKNAVDAGLNISVNTPLCSLNENYLETVKFAQQLGVKYFSCSGLIMTGNSTDDNAKDTYLSKEAITEIIKKATNYCHQNGLEISFTSPGWIDKSNLQELGLVVPSCGACLSNMGIAPDGSVVPCQSWLSNNNLGNILDIDFKHIWNSKECKKIRKQAVKSFETCLLAKNKEDNHENN